MGRVRAGKENMNLQKGTGVGSADATAQVNARVLEGATGRQRHRCETSVVP